MKGPTDRQAELLWFIADFGERQGFPPTLKDLRGFMKCTSDTAPHDALKALEKKGYVKRLPKLARGTTLTAKALVFLRGYVSEAEKRAPA